VEAELLAAKDNDLTCVDCRVDPTVSFDKQNSLYTRAQLDEHLESEFHARREQLRRAFIIDEGDEGDESNNGQCKCPCCPDQGEIVYSQESFLAHIESDHEDVMDFKALCGGLCQGISALELICKTFPDFAKESRRRAEAEQARRQGT
jgi:hypothetical protein